MEPMDVDDWLKTVQRKLQVVQCNNRENVLLALHQLIGPAADWWDAFSLASKPGVAGENHNQDANLPPPPPLTLEQVLVM
jgi:hypothetical protein